MTALAARRHTSIAWYERLAPNSFSHNPAYLVTKDELICFDRHNLWLLFCPLSHLTNFGETYDLGWTASIVVSRQKEASNTRG
jgi:hypothetical protein